MATDFKKNDFEALPKRISLDSSILQTLHTYGGFIYDGESFDVKEGIWPENIEALRNIFLVQSRALHEFALSENSLIEVKNKGDTSYLQWAFEMLDYWQSCIRRYENSPFGGQGISLAGKLEESQFGYLGTKDRKLIQDATILECDVFLTIDHKLSKNAGHIHKEIGIKILMPTQYWSLLRPWASLYF